MNTNVPDLEWMENVTYNELAVARRRACCAR